MYYFKKPLMLHIVIKGRWDRLTVKIKWKWRKELDQLFLQTVCTCFCKLDTVQILPPFHPYICRASFAKSKEQLVLQPDFRFWKARFAASKQCAQIISHCLTARHSPHTQVTTKTHRCCFSTSVCQKRQRIYWVHYFHKSSFLLI
jgi:hypothetical protein